MLDTKVEGSPTAVTGAATWLRDTLAKYPNAKELHSLIDSRSRGVILGFSDPCSDRQKLTGGRSGG